MENKKDKFNGQQARIELLCSTCKILPKITEEKNFQCVKINGRCSDILKLYPYHCTIKSLDFFGNIQDSLFINKIANKATNCNTSFIYLTPHLAYVHQFGGKSISELIIDSTELIECFKNSTHIPKHILRSFDGHCVEFYEYDETTTTTIQTLGMFLNKESEQGLNNLCQRKLKHLDAFQFLLSTLIEGFARNKFIPYILHPDRLIICPQSGIIKILSLNLYTYAFAPQNSEKKIRSALYSHPVSFQSKKPSNLLIDILNIDLLSIFLDFFHSSFVTVLWIYSVGRYQNLYRIKRNANTLMQREILLQNKIIKNKHKIKLNDSKNPYQSHQKYCDNKFGFCLEISKHLEDGDEIFNVIHNYCCIHLLESMPIILMEAINDSQRSNNIQHIVNAVMLQFKIFTSFLDKLKALISKI